MRNLRKITRDPRGNRNIQTAHQRRRRIPDGLFKHDARFLGAYPNNPTSSMDCCHRGTNVPTAKLAGDLFNRMAYASALDTATQEPVKPTVEGGTGNAEFSSMRRRQMRLLDEPG